MSNKPYLPYREAKKYFAEKGIAFDDSRIEVASPFRARNSLRVRKSYALALLEDEGLLDDFSNKYWPWAKTKSGQVSISNYHSVKEKK